MAKKSRAGKSYKEHYSAYKINSTYNLNKMRRLTRVCKEQPNNEVAAAALRSAINAPYIRNRRSRGHTCKPTTYILRPYKIDSKKPTPMPRRYNVMPNSIPIPRIPIQDQFVALGLAKARRPNVRRNKRTINKSM